MATKIVPYNVAKSIITKFDIITPEDVDEVYVYEDGIYVKGDTILKKYLSKTLRGMSSINKINEIISLVKYQTYISRQKIQNVPVNLIAVQNGILDINERKIIDFSPKYIFFNKLPVNFDKDAKCPEWDKFLSEVVSKDDRETLQRIVGISLRRDTAYQKALLLYGKGGQGKSTFLKTIVSLLGRQNCSNLTLQQLCSDMFAPIQLYEKLANIAPDIPKNGLTNSSIFKAVVSGDPISARTLHKPYIEFEPYAKLMFSANEVPKPYDHTDAFFDRWVFVKFGGKNFRDTGDEVPNYEETFTNNPSEMSGILNWALDGIFKVECYGFCDVKNVKSNWLRYSDSVYAFIIDKVGKGTADDWLAKEHLYNEYRKYCTENDIPATNISAENSFHKTLQYTVRVQKYQPSVDGKQVNSWRFIKLK